MKSGKINIASLMQGGGGGGDRKSRINYFKNIDTIRQSICDTSESHVGAFVTSQNHILEQREQVSVDYNNFACV